MAGLGQARPGLVWRSRRVGVWHGQVGLGGRRLASPGEVGRGEAVRVRPGGLGSAGQGQVRHGAVRPGGLPVAARLRVARRSSSGVVRSVMDGMAG